MAIFKKAEEKTAIKTALNTFFASKGTTLHAFCKDKKNELDYSQVHQKISRGNIDEEYVNKLIAKVDKAYKLQKFGSTFMVSKL